MARNLPGLVPDALLAGLLVERREMVWARALATPAPGSSIHVAEVDGAVVGFGSGCTQRSARLRDLGFDGEVSALYVRAAFQRRGTGLALMRALASDLASSSHRGLGLWVLRENRQGRTFYESLGGRQVDEREERHGDGTLAEIAYG